MIILMIIIWPRYILPLAMSQIFFLNCSMINLWCYMERGLFLGEDEHKQFKVLLYLRTWIMYNTKTLWILWRKDLSEKIRFINSLANYFHLESRYFVWKHLLWILFPKCICIIAKLTSTIANRVIKVLQNSESDCEKAETSDFFRK